MICPSCGGGVYTPKTKLGRVCQDIFHFPSRDPLGSVRRDLDVLHR